MKGFAKSIALMAEARNVLVGGVNSPVRAFRNLDVPAPFMERGEGASIEDADGNRYVDYVLSWGPLILGHCHPDVVQAIQKQAGKALTFGAPTELETSLARKIQTHFPLMEKIRFVSSGTEACMSAIRAARGFTGRNLLLKFDGCYHGHADSLLVKSGSGLLTHAHPDSAGVSSQVAASTLVARFNDLESVSSLVKAYPEQIAAIMLEPVTGNMGVLLPEPQFLQGLRTLCDQHGIVLIFDEVMSGYRVSMGGATAVYGVTPDMVVLGKVIGGGLPVGAYGGKKAIMSCVSPEGPVYQAGTLSGNPLGMVSGLTTLTILEELNPWKQLQDYVTKLEQGLGDLLNAKGIPYTMNSACSMFTLFFVDGPVRVKEDVDRHEKSLFKKFFEGMLRHGIYLPCSQYEACFVSVCHGHRELSRTLDAAGKVLAGI